MNADRRHRRHSTARPPGRRGTAVAAAAALVAGLTIAVPGAAAAVPAPAAVIGLSSQVYGVATTTTPAGSPVAFDIATTVGGSAAAGRITTTVTTPTGVRLLGAAGTGWACGAARLQAVSCISNQIPDAGTVLGTLTVTAVTTTPVASTAIAGATIQATDGAQTVTAPTATTAADPSAPTVSTVEPAVGPRAGHTPLTITGTGLAAATAVQIGTNSQLMAGTGTTLVRCDTVTAPQCFTEKDGVLSVSSMPAGGGDVSIRVLAHGAAGAGSYQYKAIPDAPVVTATPISQGVDLAWTAPTAGTANLTGYIVTATRDGAAAADLTRTLPIGSTSTRFDGLGVGAIYQFAVRATSSAGDSQPGTSATAVPFTVPTAPLLVNAQPGATLGDGSVELGWSEPSNDGSSPNTGYQVTPIRDGIPQTPVNFGPDGTNQLINGLDVGHRYEFVVSAINAAGSSSQSSPSASLNIPAADTGGQALELLPLSAPAGQTSRNYYWRPRAVGGTAPYTWSVAGGALPAGLSIDNRTGLIQGAPARSGTFTAEIRVTDTDGTVAQTVVTVIIRDSIFTGFQGGDVRTTIGTPTTLEVGVTDNSSGSAVNSGTVRFAARHDSGFVIVVGDSPVVAGKATMTATLPKFGLWTWTSRYVPDDSVASESGSVNFLIAPVLGSVAFTGYRASGPGGPTDQYAELTNMSGRAISTDGLTLFGYPQTQITLPAITLLPGRSLLVAGPDFVPTGNTVPDLVAPRGLGSGDLLLVNLYSQAFVDSVGPDQFDQRRPGPLPDVGQPSTDYAWIRPQQNGFYRNTGDNTVDFALVSGDGAPVSGLTAMAGSASPQSSTSPWFHAGDLESTLLDPSVAESVTPNRTITKQSGQPGGTIVSRRVITNRTAQTMDKVQLRLIDLSQANGLPGLTLPNGATTAALRGIAPPTPTASFRINGQTVTAQQLTPSGSGLNAVYPVPLPQGGLTPGQSVAVTLTFQADTGGQFRFRYLAEGHPAGQADSQPAS